MSNDKTAQYPACKGMNCGTTDGRNHSAECQAEHAAAVAGGRFVKGVPEQPSDFPERLFHAICDENMIAPGSTHERICSLRSRLVEYREAVQQVTDEPDCKQKMLDYLSDILDAKDVMLAAGIEQGDFPAMFKAFANLKTTPPSAQQAEQPAQGEVVRFPGFSGDPDHILKTDPDAFDAVAAGVKTHEIRKDDRGFKVGDKLLLKRTRYTGAQMHMRPQACPLEYTGEEERRVVSHVQRGYGLGDGWVILSFATQRAPSSPPVAQDAQQGQGDVDKVRASLAAIHARLKFGGRIDSHTISIVIAECEHAIPELVGIAAPGAGGKGGAA